MAAPVLGILGSQKPAATTDATLYTVPSGRRCVVSTLSVAEVGGAAATFRLHAVASGGSPSVSNAIAYEIALPAKSRYGFTEGYTLSAGQSIRVYASTANVAFTLFGEETDVPS